MKYQLANDLEFSRCYLSCLGRSDTVDAMSKFLHCTMTMMSYGDQFQVSMRDFDNQTHFLHALDPYIVGTTFVTFCTEYVVPVYNFVFNQGRTFDDVKKIVAVRREKENVKLHKQLYKYDKGHPFERHLRIVQRYKKRRLN